MDSFLLLRRLVAAIVFKGQTVSDYWWSRRTIFLTHGDRGIFIFPVQLTTSRIGNLTRLIHTLLYVMTIHTYIHTYISLTHVVTTVKYNVNYKYRMCYW